MASVIAYMLMCLVLASELFMQSSPHPHEGCHGKNENMKSLSQVVTDRNQRLVLAGVSTTKICGLFYMDAEKCICQDFAAGSYRLFLQGENDFFVFSKSGEDALQAKKYTIENDGLKEDVGVDVAQPKALVAGISSRGKDVFCYHGKSVLKNSKDDLCSCDDKAVPCSPDGVSSSVANKISCGEVSIKGRKFTITYRNGTEPKTFDVGAGFNQLQVWNKDWNATQVEGCQDICLTTTAAPTTTEKTDAPTTPPSPVSETSAPKSPEATSSSSSTEQTTESSSESAAESDTPGSTNVAHAGSNNSSTLLYIGMGVGILLMTIGALLVLAVLYRWIPGVYVDPRKVQLKPSRDQIFG